MSSLRSQLLREGGEANTWLLRKRVFQFHRWARHPSKARPSLFGNMRIGRDEKYNWRRWEIQLAEMRNTIGRDEKYRWSPKSIRGQDPNNFSNAETMGFVHSPLNRQTSNLPPIRIKLKALPLSCIKFSFHPISSSELQLCGWHLSFVPSGRRLALHRSRSQKVKPRRFLQGGITAFPLLPRHRTTTSFQLQTNIGFYAIQSMIQLFTATPTPTILTLMTHFEVFRRVFFFQK